MPASVWFGTGKNIKDSVKYKYDSCGNISEIKQNGHIMARYMYDALNRLIREDNKLLNKTTVFTYDTNGNITERCEYAYTVKEGEELSKLNCTHVSYDYDGDKLISYKGENISYNTFGNPLAYRGKTLGWQYGKRLTSYDGIAFAYDGAGRRVSKGTITYIYDSNGRLITQNNGLEFIYDNSGIIGVKHNGNIYFYRKDAQGNIIAILDYSGDVVVEYKYDAWGNHAVLDASGMDITAETHIGNMNPFRYRGYYYDTETDLYFLQTRYYDPETGRFISRDSIEYADPETINGLNLYAYCGNDPVMCADPSGHFAISTFLIGLAASWVLSSIASYYLGEHLVGGALSIFGGVQTIATGVSLLAYGPVGWVIGGAAIVLGAVNIAFGTAELQQHFTGNNWIKDIGITGELYTVLYVGSSIASAAVSIGGTAYMNSSSGRLAYEIQKNAKHWNRGTFKTKFGTLKYHLKQHGRGLSPTEYTNRALRFYDDYHTLLRPNYSAKYKMMRYIYKNKIGVGYYDVLGYIIDFIVRGEL